MAGPPERNRSVSFQFSRREFLPCRIGPFKRRGAQHLCFSAPRECTCTRGRTLTSRSACLQALKTGRRIVASDPASLASDEIPGKRLPTLQIVSTSTPPHELPTAAVQTRLGDPHGDNRRKRKWFIERQRKRTCGHNRSNILSWF